MQTLSQWAPCLVNQSPASGKALESGKHNLRAFHQLACSHPSLSVPQSSGKVKFWVPVRLSQRMGCSSELPGPVVQRGDSTCCSLACTTWVRTASLVCVNGDACKQKVLCSRFVDSGRCRSLSRTEPKHSLPLRRLMGWTCASLGCMSRSTA